MQRQHDIITDSTTKGHMACCIDDICWPDTETDANKFARHKDYLGRASDHLRQTWKKRMESKRDIVPYAMGRLHLLNQEASCIGNTQ